MKDRPLIMYPHEVRAVRDGRQTQFRRVIKSPARVMQLAGAECITRNEPDAWYGVYAWSMRDKNGTWNDYTNDQFYAKCPYGVPGDRLWVRETWARPVYDWRLEERDYEYFRPILYAADNGKEFFPLGGNYTQRKNCVKWHSSTTMPRWASRLLLEVVSVRVERLQEISLADMNAEGIACSDCWTEGEPYRDFPHPEHCGCRSLFINTWNSINGKAHPWEKNDWVWATEFKRID